MWKSFAGLCWESENLEVVSGCADMMTSGHGEDACTCTSHLQMKMAVLANTVSYLLLQPPSLEGESLTTLGESML